MLPSSSCKRWSYAARLASASGLTSSARVTAERVTR